MPQALERRIPGRGREEDAERHAGQRRERKLGGRPCSGSTPSRRPGRSACPPPPAPAARARSARSPPRRAATRSRSRSRARSRARWRNRSGARPRRRPTRPSARPPRDHPPRRGRDRATTSAPGSWTTLRRGPHCLRLYPSRQNVAHPCTLRSPSWSWLPGTEVCLVRPSPQSGRSPAFFPCYLGRSTEARRQPRRPGFKCANLGPKRFEKRLPRGGIRGYSRRHHR